MNLPKDGTKPLAKDEFDWITLNVIFQGQKDKKNCPFALILTHTVCLFQGCVVNCIYFVMYSFPMMMLMKCEETDLIKLL